MAFSEKIKISVKKRAMFRCCRCQELGVDVHHILPQKDGGTDDLSNAAPLCQNCHDQFGDNPSKRKEIRQMRDNWYEVVEKRQNSQTEGLYPLLEKLNSSLEELKEDRSNTTKDLDIIKETLKEISNNAIDNMTIGTAEVTASNLVNASGASLSNVEFNGIPKIIKCPECSTVVMIEGSENSCPECSAFLFPENEV